MHRYLIGVIAYALVFTVCAQTKPGQFSHLAKYAGSWAVELIYEDPTVTLLLSKDFRINLAKFRDIKEDAISQIDVVRGNMLISSSSKEDPCLSSTFMSVALTDDNTVYLLAMRDRKIKIFHTTFGQITKDMKAHKYSKEVAVNLKKMVNQCKIKGLQNA